jgi:RNA polymerase sigma-32 factor
MDCRWETSSPKLIWIWRLPKRDSSQAAVRVFSTFALWWIKATIQEYILRSWPLVKIGTTSTQKKLFFRLRGEMKNLFVARRLAEQPPTLDHLGREMSISPERVRQIEARAFAKVQRAAWKHLRPGAEYVIDPSHRSPLEHQSASSRSAAQSQELQHEPVL